MYFVNYNIQLVCVLKHVVRIVTLYFVAFYLPSSGEYVMLIKDNKISIDLGIRTPQ